MATKKQKAASARNIKKARAARKGRKKGGRKKGSRKATAGMMAVGI